MVKVSPSFTTFQAGEFSPKLDGRVDLQKYTQAAKKIENMTIHPQGGAARRPGSIFVREVKNSQHNVRLIPFEFNVTQAYILEFGDQYFRIHKDGGTVVSSDTPVEIATPYLHTELADLKFTQSNDLLFIAHQNHAPRQITRTSHTSWTVAEVDFIRGPMLDANSTSTTLTANGRTSSVTITASANTFASTDVGRLVKLHHGFAKITAFSSATSVTATVQENEAGVAELSPTITAATISFHEGDPSATGNEHNDRLEDTGGGFVDAGFEAGMSISVTGSTSNNVSNVLIAQVTATTILLEPGADLADEAAASGHTVTGDLLADKAFQLGAFSNTTGFPGQVALHEQRLIFSNTNSQPRTLFFSKSGDFTNFTPGTSDASSLIFTLASDTANEVRYLQPGRFLQVGTSGGEFTVTSTNEGPLTPTTTQILKQGTYGSSKIQPVSIGNATLFVQRAKRKIREFVFDLQSDSYQAPDLTLLAEHITEGGIKELAYQQEPDNILWACLDNGKLIGLTYRREEGVIAWHNHLIGGASSNGSYGSVESVACIPGDLDEDDLYMVVERTGFAETLSFTQVQLVFTSGSTAVKVRFLVAPGATSIGETIAITVTSASSVFTSLGVNLTTLNNTSQTVTDVDSTNNFIEVGFTLASASGSTAALTDSNSGSVTNTGTRRYVEYLSAYDFGSTASSAFFVDSGLTYSGSSANTISGLSHLEGQTVAVNANGAAHANKTVSSGAISLDISVTKAHIGFPYTSTLQTMRIDAGGAQGTAQGKIKRIHDMTARFFRTVGAKIGTSESELDRIFFRSASDEMDQALDLFDGDKDIEFRGGYETDGHIVIQQDQPLPMTVIGLFPRLITFDE